MSLKQKVIQAIERAVEQNDREAQETYCKYLNQLMAIEEDVDPTENGRDLEDIVRQKLEDRRQSGVKFRMGDISSEISSEYTVRESEVRPVVKEVLDDMDDVVEGEQKWLSFES